MATREFFPRTFRWAVKQRTRWVTGIALQSWARHGWSGGFKQAYWLWRDRKGLIGNPVSLLANLTCLYGVATWLIARSLGVPWGLGAELVEQNLVPLLSANLTLQLIHLSARMACVARIYGVPFAMGAPLRTVYGNLLNSVSSVCAIYTFVAARLYRRPLVWVKTEHAYPSRVALLPHKRPLEEILVGSAYLEPRDLAYAQKSKPRGIRLSEHLVHLGMLSEEELSEVLSLQLGLALGKIESHEVRRHVARSLPAHVIREWNVVPVKIESGSLHLASPDLPTEELHEVLRRFTRLEIRVQLITPTNFRRLANELL
jgi:adsorption protein B